LFVIGSPQRLYQTEENDSFWRKFVMA